MTKVSIMSAQAGIYHFDGKPPDPEILAQMGEAIKHYGPDSGNTHIGGSLGMVYRAFHTTAESRLERQPFKSDRGNIFTWDGRLDNRDELIDLLSNDVTQASSDLAIVAAAFDQWDTHCFRKLVGDWAVTIWSSEKRELLFACDYMAIRHIFYYLKQDRITWSTDLASLVLFSGDKFCIDDDYIAGYLANDPDAHLTPYREIREVPPGQFVSVRNSRASIERFWRFSPKSRIRYNTDAEYEEHFRHLFRQSVRRRLRSDSPILAELSGGLDSSSIVCVADGILASEATSNSSEIITPRLDTISFYDKTEPNGDDWVYFPIVEHKRGRVGVHIDASRLGTAPSSLQRPEFSALPGNLGAWTELEAERAAGVRSGGYRAVLSGIGGDEFMGGIANPSAHLADLILQCKVVLFAKQLMAWSLIQRRPWIQSLWDVALDLLPPSLSQHFVKEGKVESWIDKDFAKRTKIALRQLEVDEHFGLWLPTRRSCVTSVMFMANKLAKGSPPPLALEELRYPYLDQNLVEFVLSIPASQLVRPGKGRLLMRRSLVGIVPHEILSRRSKQLGSRSAVVAIDKNREEVCTLFDSPLSALLGYINGTRFLEELTGARNGKDIHILKMLRTISLELWLCDLAARGLLNNDLLSSPLFAAMSLHAHA
jgi:asparagine synthase (glutamine-hydrolysing)